MPTRLTLLAAVLMLAACAAAMPGYSPPPFKEKNKFGQAQESGGVGSDGRYEMSDTEKALDCKRLTGSMQIAIARMKDGHGRDAPSETSTTMQAWYPSVLSKSTAGTDREMDHARERAKLEAYNQQLAAKNCRTLDIEAELARPPEAPGRKY